MAERKWCKSIKRIVVVILSIFVILLLLTGIGLRKQIASVSSIKHIGSDLYQMTYYSDYKLDKMLEVGVSNEQELTEFISKELFFGYPVEGNENYYGCTAFFAQTEDGDYICGRNFDYNPTDCLILYTAPEDGYASYSMVDLDVLGIGKENETSSDELFGRISMLAAPYVPTDGMNEMGLCISTLELETEEIHQDNGNVDLMLNVALRAMLDRCADVEEAIAFLKNVDIHTFFEYPFHLLMTDTKGTSVVVEWIDGQISILEQKICTNFQLSEGKDYLVGIGHDRYEIVEKFLADCQGILSEADAMQLLNEAKIEWNGEWDTEWSTVYNQTDFTVDICIRMDYENVFHLEKNDFE